MELCPTEFINTSLGFFPLRLSFIFFSISKHICTHSSCTGTKTNSSALEAVPCDLQLPLSSHSPLPNLWSLTRLPWETLEHPPLPKKQEGRRALSPECVSRGRTVGRDGKKMNLTFMEDSFPLIAQTACTFGLAARSDIGLLLYP